VSILNERLSTYQEDRGVEILHASAVTHPDGFCPREFSLRALLNVKPPPDKVYPALAVCFDVGNSYNRLLRDKWLREIVVGDWGCEACGRVYARQRIPRGRCRCGASRDCFKYQEISLVDSQTGISGSLDALVDFGLPKLRLVEVKSMTDRDFKTLTAPYGEHKVRTLLYLWLLRESSLSGIVGYDKAHILYVSKGYGSKAEGFSSVSPFKEYTVSLDEEGELLVKPYLDLAKQYTGFVREGGKLPPQICDTAFCPRAKWCPVKDKCFSPEYHSATYGPVDFSKSMAPSMEELWGFL
jgi:hypothetical protein